MMVLEPSLLEGFTSRGEIFSRNKISRFLELKGFQMKAETRLQMMASTFLVFIGSVNSVIRTLVNKDIS